MSNELLKPKELAALLKCSVELIYKMVKARRIPYIKFCSDIRFKASNIEKWLESRTIKQKPI